MAVTRLITGEATFFAAGFLVEPVAVGVEIGFGEIVVEGDVEGFGEFASFLPGFGFHADAVDIGCEGEMF